MLKQIYATRNHSPVKVQCERAENSVDLRGHSRQFANDHFEENVFEKNTGNRSVIVVNGMSNGQKQTEKTNTFTTLNS